MGTELAPFAQFGVAGLLAGIAYALVRWALARADGDREEVKALNLWIREKGWASMASMERTMNEALNLVDKQGVVLEKLASKHDVSSPPSNSRRRPPS